MEVVTSLRKQSYHQLCLTLQPWFWVGALACLSVGTVWGLAFAPQDYQQGDSFRIIYIHVPSAILSMGTYGHGDCGLGGYGLAVAQRLGEHDWDAYRQ